MKFLKEITDWSKSGNPNMPNHTYAFEGESCVGYIREGTTELVMFKVPSKGFSKRYRKFKEVTV
jgi:hypothetical protein